MPSQRVTIERDKIRHRRPDDMRAVDNEEPYPLDEPEPLQYGAEEYEEASESWSDEEEAWSEEEPLSSDDDDQGWGDESEDEWSFEETEEQDPEDESGIIWGDDEADDAFDSQGYDGGEQFVPEPAPVGRRDHRPQSPRSFTPDPLLNGHQGHHDVERFKPDVAPSIRQGGRPQPARPLPPEPRSAPSRSGTPDNGRRAPNSSRQRTPKEPVSHRSPPPPQRQPTPPSPSGRFGQAEAPIEAGQERPRPERPEPGQLREAPQQGRFAGPPKQNRRTTSRRNQPSLSPVMLPVRKKSFGGVLVKLIVAGCLVIGGWFVFQELGRSGVSGLSTKMAALIGMSPERTAEDTSFGSPTTVTTTTTTTPEQALANLTSGANGSDTHVPKFKPRDDGQALDGTPQPSAATPPEDNASPTIIERLLSFFE